MIIGRRKLRFLRNHDPVPKIPLKCRMNFPVIEAESSRPVARTNHLKHGMSWNDHYYKKLNFIPFTRLYILDPAGIFGMRIVPEETILLDMR
jgi:hypothetical protein